MPMDQEKQWWQDHGNLYAEAFLQHVKEESIASKIIFFNVSIVPGLLQCENYAHAILKKNIGSNQEMVNKRLKFRMNRQWKVFEQENPPEILAIIGEESLLRQYGGEEVNREQLIHLKQLSSLPNIKILVMPVTYGDTCLTINGRTSFTMLNNGGADKIYFEVEAQTIISDNSNEILFYKLELEKVSQSCIDFKDYISEKV